MNRFTATSQNKNRFPATRLAIFRLAELKLVLHGVAQKSEQKKFISFSEILKHCLAENPTF